MIPVRTGYLPIMTAARVGEQTVQAAYPLVNFIPERRGGRYWAFGKGRSPKHPKSVTPSHPPVKSEVGTFAGLVLDEAN